MKHKIFVIFILIVIFPVLFFVNHLYKGYGASIIYTQGTKKKDLKYFSAGAKIINIPYQKEEFISKRKIDAITYATPIEGEVMQTVYADKKKPRNLQISRPYNNASFPLNIAPPLFRWNDVVNNLWLIEFDIEGESIKVVAGKKSYRPGRLLWNKIKRRAVGKYVKMTVLGCNIDKQGKIKNNTIQKCEPVLFRISKFPADEVIIYRLVRPSFSGSKTPDIYLRFISSFKTKIFLPSGSRFCYSCHAFSSKSKSKRFSIQMRDMVKGGREFGIYEIEEESGKYVKTPFGGSTFMNWSPDGKNLALSVRQKLTTIAPITQETQYAYSTTADIAVYNIERNSIYLLPGASDPGYLENYPCWSEDGETIAFCRDEIKTAKDGRYRQKYNIHLIPYNNGKGGIPVPLKGGSFNGKSNYYPRFSPDGRWLLFCKADYGSLIKPTSDLYLYSIRTGQTRKLQCNVDYAADSWHSWSSNSKWIVFASKRDDGIFAKLYLTEIDDNGYASPPIMLPEKDSALKCYNVPEFQKEAPRINHRKLFKILSNRDLLEITENVEKERE